MDLHRYYKENKDRINSSIVKIASDLAVGRMVDKYKQPFEAFVEPDDPDDPDSGTHYKEEFQDEYNKFYDEEYERVASLMRFDIGTEDGIRRDGTDDPIVSLAPAGRRRSETAIGTKRGVRNLPSGQPGGGESLIPVLHAVHHTKNSSRS